MTAPRTTQPDLNTLDVAALKALILSQQQQLRSKDEQLLSKDQQLLSKDEQLLSREHEIEHLKLLIAKLQRMQFGRKSEKVERQIEQLTLKLEELGDKPRRTRAGTRACPGFRHSAARLGEEETVAASTS